MALGDLCTTAVASGGGRGREGILMGQGGGKTGPGKVEGVV